MKPEKEPSRPLRLPDAAPFCFGAGIRARGSMALCVQRNEVTEAICMIAHAARVRHGLYAYCATPLPNDQFSFAVSSRLMRTSCGRSPGSAESFSTTRR